MLKSESPRITEKNGALKGSPLNDNYMTKVNAWGALGWLSKK
mgnify:CR=1 FL=1